MKRLSIALATLVLASAALAATPDENKRIAREFTEVVYNQKQLDEIPRYVADHFIDRSPGAPAEAKGPAYVRSQAEGSLASFPDLSFEILRMMAEDDLVTLHWRATGTSAPEGGLPGGKKTRLEGISIFRMEKGKIVESWDIVDRVAMFRQLGFELVPPSQ